MRSLPILAAVAASALLAPAAHAATKTVTAGLRPDQAAKLPAGATANAFYPRSVKVNAGGQVAFKFAGFHNLIFPEGQSLPPFHAPDASNPVTGVKDAAGADFWFNGRPNWMIAPVHVVPQGDTVVDGSALDGSGVFQGPGAPPDYVASFPKKGTYSFLCSIHPGMKGKVRVLPKSAQAPSRAHDARTAAKQARKTIKLAKKLAAERIKGNVVRAGNDAKDVAFLSYFPGTRAIKAGESVRFELSKDTTEIHNVVFGPEDVVAAAAGAFIQIGPAGISYDPRSVYPSDQGALAYDGANHGDGFLNAGLLDRDSSTPLPSAVSVSFPVAGTYGFICTVHGPSMQGTIEVS